MKKEEDKYYIKEEDWKEIEKQQNALVQISDSEHLKSDNTRFKRVIEDYFVTNEGDEIKVGNIETLNKLIKL